MKFFGSKKNETLENIFKDVAEGDKLYIKSNCSTFDISFFYEGTEESKEFFNLEINTIKIKEYIFNMACMNFSCNANASYTLKVEDGVPTFK